MSRRFASPDDSAGRGGLWGARGRGENRGRGGWPRGRGGWTRGRGGWTRGRGGWTGGRGGLPKDFFAQTDRGTPLNSKTGPTSTPEPPLGALLRSLKNTDFDDDAKEYTLESAITNCRAVASYNWLDREEPTIIIPGKPPRWTPLAEPRQLKPDDGQYFRDPNAGHYPKHPIEPAITAVLNLNPEVCQGVDIVACGSTLGNLLRFIRGEDKQFRMLVELVGETVFFIRRENTMYIPDVKGFGHSFPEAYTTWDAKVKGSSSHQRVLSYNFGGLDLLVRFEGDGYLLDDNEEGAEDVGGHKASMLSDLDATLAVDELAAELDHKRLADARPAQGGDLKVKHCGDLVDQDRIFELKTRSVKRKEADTFEDTFGDQLPRLWVAQIPKFVLAYHKYGLFEDISIRDARSDIRSWERDHVDVLSRLAALLHHIASLVRSRPDDKLELRHQTVGTLEVREQLPGTGDALSDSVKDLWEASGVTCNDDTTSGEAVLESEEDLSSSDWDEGSEPEPDFTACSAEDCGYCGRCSY